MPEGMDGVLLETGREGCTYHPIYHVWSDEGEYTGECLRKKKGKRKGSIEITSGFNCSDDMGMPGFGLVAVIWLGKVLIPQGICG